MSYAVCFVIAAVIQRLPPVVFNGLFLAAFLPWLIGFPFHASWTFWPGLIAFSMMFFHLVSVAFDGLLWGRRSR
jgi:hypothetical protein